MTGADLSRLSVQQLVDHFTEVTLEQDDALLMDDLRRFRRLFDAMQRIKAELRSRGGDQRRALIGLFNHKNAQVRLHAAIATLAIAPDQAKGVLRRIKDQKEHPQALEAGMTLWDIDRGVFKPT